MKTTIYAGLLSALILFSASCKRPDGSRAEEEFHFKLDSAYLLNNPMGIEFTASEQAMIDSGFAEILDSYEKIRAYGLENSIAPVLQFNPLPYGFQLPQATALRDWDIPDQAPELTSQDDLAYLSIAELASLIRSGQISCQELTAYYLDRLKTHDPKLHCVISYTEAYALKQAEKLDTELKSGIDRGILHGIPYGAKDLFAFAGYPTTWGAMPYRDQMIQDTAGIIKQLEEAGAVLIAKTTLGALAMGDVWFADTTRNPWNTDEGSSGSSAGSAAATAAGLLPFAIGTETWGSIVSPSNRCGTTGLRPSYGRVSRAGAMALSWSMDKVGPICRSAEDCAIVFDVLRQADPEDKHQISAGFTYPSSMDVSGLRIAYLEDAFSENFQGRENARRTLRTLRKMGADPVAINLELEYIPVEALSLVLDAEAAAAFDQLTRSGEDSLLVRQHRYAWPNIFRTARFLGAVEYIQAQRIRSELVEAMHASLKEYDVIVSPSFGGNQLLATNLTGQPVVVLPNGFDDDGTPTSISFLGNLFDEGSILALAAAYQEVTDFHLQQPPGFP